MSQEILTGDYTVQDLMHVIAFLQCELDSREIVIDKLKRTLLQTNYPDISLESDNPLHALARDSLLYDEPQVAHSYIDPRLRHFEGLISSQQELIHKLQDRLRITEDKYAEALVSPDQSIKDEAAGTDTDQSQSLRCECERLRLEVASERLKSEHLANDVKLLLSGWIAQKILINKQKKVAVDILKERAHMLDSIAKAKEKIKQLENALCSQTRNCKCKLDLHPTSDVAQSQNFHGTSGSASNKVHEALKTTLCDQPDMERTVHTNDKLSPEHRTVKDAVASIIPRCSTRSIHSVTCSTEVQRPKPTPPARRSSEITTDAHKCRPVMDLKTSDPVSSTNHASTDVGKQPSSRSSTPSPPPPPPVQLHFPYPGMLGSSNSTLITGSNPHHSNVSNSGRFSTGTTLHHHLLYSDNASFGSLSHTTNSTPLSRYVCTGSLASVPHGFNPRKPITVGLHSRSHHGAWSSIPAAASRSSVVTGTSPVKSSATVVSTGHHLPAYYTSHSMPTSAISPAPNTTGFSTPSATAPSSDITGANLNSNHLYINGK